ncbi:hypothetical protein BD311DRAFT_757466 [Dichomitus squalens]|uniref:Peptidase S9 prolyl oligopeptidase catalytic domain-containing protein n=1 Tax=Dichomitus squalens TaxID=114155 RepID=A0A4Q9MP66_9APHY|nr:hypothetical protein BD311DRAFT_757466 [Dichomitus squalens]
MVADAIRAALLTLIGLNLSAATSTSTGDTQAVMTIPAVTENQTWTVSLSQDWDVLGPFPIHAREQHFLSTSFPLKLTDPIDLNATWPSSYADGGSVGWTKAQSLDDVIEVSYPSVRWAALRATEGWAALQHHSVLRSVITVYPPSNPSNQETSIPRLLVDLDQGSFFTLLPSDNKDDKFVPEWHAGNIYALGRAPPNAVSLPYPPSTDSPTTYEIVVSGDYEIRLFGDPRFDLGSEVPKTSIILTVDIQDMVPAVVRVDSHDVVSDFVDGWAFGNAVGVGLRSLDGWWTVTGASVSANLAEIFEVSLLQKARIAPTQTRIIPITLTQRAPLRHDSIELTLTVESQDAVSEVRIAIPVEHYAQWSADDVPAAGIKASFFYGTSMPASFIVIPPREPTNAPPPPILALHGAGLDALKEHRLSWVEALPRQRHSWVILPAGRTEWGLDWHGPSTREAWNTVEALSDILGAREEWRSWSFAPDTRVLLMGHSNGGQGAWYVGGRYPDRIVGVVPAAGYIKSQAYVPWVQSRSAHYIDPALRALLDSSLTPDDNDLFLSNLADTPILAIHGGDDENVPVWHTRELVATLKTWNPHANVTYREDSGQHHWYEGLFLNDAVKTFVASTLSGEGATAAPSSRSYTLTVAVPSDSGSLHGWSVHSLSIPGRLGRLGVDIKPGGISVRTTNIKAFSIRLGSLPEDVKNVPFLVDGQSVELDEASWDQPDFFLALAQEQGVWSPYPLFDVQSVPPTGRILNVLSSAGPITIVIPSQSPSAQLSAGLRIAHNLDVYHKLDADIITEDEAATRMRDGSLASANIVVLARGELGAFSRSILEEARTPFKISGTSLKLRGRLLNGPSMATLFLHPHPTNANSLVLFAYGADMSGFERAVRLFPIRTGVTVPDWIVVGRQADERGTGGVHGAGVWGNNWSWNEAMSAF